MIPSPMHSDTRYFEVTCYRVLEKKQGNYVKGYFK